MPDRTSSLRTSNESRNEARQLRETKKAIEKNLREEEKRLKVQATFDAGFWTKLIQIDQKWVEATQLGRKASILEYGCQEGNIDHEDAWKASEDGRRILEIEAMLAKRLSHIHRQKELFSAPSNPARTLRKAFTQMFIRSARFGMDIPNTAERQTGPLQDQFKEELIELMEKNPPGGKLSSWAWCPIMKEYCDKEIMVASHLFPAGATQETMDAIFGPQELYMWGDQATAAISQPEAKGELFRACNGIYWSHHAADRFRKGYFVLVPDLDADCTRAQARAWQESAVKEYRIRVIRPDAPDMQQSISPRNLGLWCEIDDQRVEWGSPVFRPRARYLYWTYLVALLRTGHDSAQERIGRKGWGSGGAYVKKNMLSGFLEEIGHSYDEAEFMDAVMDPDSENEPSELAVMIAIEDILSKNKAAEEVDDDDSDDE